MTTKINSLIPLNSLRISKEKKDAVCTNTTLSGFHYVQNIQGNQIWFVFDYRAPKIIEF